MKLIPDDINIPFMEYRKYFVIGSLVLILLSILSIVAQGGLKAGIDFSGGTELQLQFNNAVDISEIRREVGRLEGVGDYEVQGLTSGGANEYLIRIQEATDKLDEGMGQRVIDSMNARFGEGSSKLRREESVGPKIGGELREKAFWAVFFAVIGMALYIWYAFRSLSYGIGAVVALIHDVVITIGVFSLLGKEFNLPIIAALLTIVGYSVNDTIIVSDRIRENVRKEGDFNFVNTVNKSLNQTLSRTILTSATTLLAVLLLLFFGGNVIHDFALALTIGVLIGTYSSIYVAAPYVIMWQDWAKKRMQQAGKMTAARSYAGGSGPKKNGKKKK
jgi:preprotein translocase subunit SecF